MDLYIPINYLTNTAAACSDASFLGFPTWYAYLECKTVTAYDPITGTDQPSEIPVFNGGADIWLVGAAVVEILLRVAIIAAIIFIVVGGVKYMTSQGNPDQTAKALHTIINACVGLVISIVAATVIGFLARSVL